MSPASYRAAPPRVGEDQLYLAEEKGEDRESLL
jgi:hypothetical protein